MLRKRRDIEGTKGIRKQRGTGSQKGAGLKKPTRHSLVYCHGKRADKLRLAKALLQGSKGRERRKEHGGLYENLSGEEEDKKIRTNSGIKAESRKSMEKIAAGVSIA